MRAREYFHRVSIAENELKMIRAQLRHYYDIGLSIQSCPSGGTGGGNKTRNTSRVELSAIGIADATEALIRQENEYVKIITQAKILIENIPQEKYRQILTYRYLCGWSFRSISDELGYHDPNSVYRAHGWALTEAQKILNKEKADSV